MSEFLGAAGDLASFALDGAGSWRARLRRAGFRGARFFVEEMSGEGGRRLANHEYPGRDVPWAEDLGRKQRRWTFTGYTIGIDYMIARDLLVQALERGGSGTLVHPTFGIVQASVESYAFNERRDLGGYCAFSLVFVESGERAAPESFLDTIAAVQVAAMRVYDVAAMVFRRFNVSGNTVAARGATSDVEALCDTFDVLRLPVYGLDQGPLVTQLNLLRLQAPAIVYAPETLATSVSDVFAAFTEASDAEHAMAAMLTIGMGFTAHTAEWETTPLSPTTRVLEKANGDAFQSYVREMALREIGYAEPGVDLISVDHAEEVRAQIMEAFSAQEDVAAAGGEDDVYEALGDLRIALVTDIEQRSAQLPELVPYTTGRSINALALAWTFYQDANRDLDVVDRVHAIHPAFMPLTGRVLNR